jgi:PAS domain S-box-containing protein
VTDQTAEAEDEAPWYGVVPEVLSGLNIGLVVAGSARAVVVNDAFCALMGYSAAEILDVQGVMDIVMPGVRDLTAEQSRRRRHGGEGPAQYETEIAHRDGRPIPVEVSAEAVGGGAGTVVATVRDLTDQKRIEVDLAARARQQETVAELGRQALVDRDVASLMATAVTGAAGILGVEYIEVQELRPDGSFLLRAGVGWGDGLVGHATVPGGVGSPAGPTLATDAPVIVDDMSQETRFGIPALLTDHDVVAGVTVVIRGEANPYGVLAAGTSRPRRFSCDDVDFLQAVANVLAEAIARDAVETELASRASQQAAVAELGRRALAELDLAVVLDSAVETVARTLDVGFVKVLERPPDGDSLHLRAGTGWREGLVGQATVGSGAGSQAGFTLASDVPIIVEDLAEERRFTAPPLLVEHGVVSGMSVIIGGRDQPWGVLGAHSSTPRRFSDDDVNFLQATANVVAEVIGRVEVEAALHAAHDRERTLRRRLQAHSRVVVEAQEAERRRIARELHDEVGQALTGLKMGLEGHEHLSTAQIAERVGRAREAAGDLLQRVHNLSLDLRPAILDDLGLRPALLSLIERFGAQTGVDVALHCSGLERRLRPEVETAAYRIVQEALTNVARHGHVRQATVDCVASGVVVRIAVADDGAGFDVGGVPVGQTSGLAGMEERARSIGGWFWLLSEPGRGTTVVAELPMSRPTR